MANQSINTALVIQFSNAVHVAAQQSQARLRPYVNMMQMSGDVFMYDGLGQVEAVELTGRNPKVEWSDIEHLRRKLVRRRFAITLPIDKMDVNGMLADPNGLYSKACVMAIMRKFDAIVVEAAFATVYTGRDGDTAVTAATDGVETVDATGGLTYNALLDIRRTYMDNDVGNDTPEKIALCITGDEYDALMSDDEIINSDYSAGGHASSGMVESAAGINFVKFAGEVANPIIGMGVTYRECIALTSRAMVVGMSKELAVAVEDRTDYYDTTQVKVTICFGAVRTEGVLVQKVTTTT